MRRLASFAALVVAACTTPGVGADQSWTPDEIKEHARQLDGKTIVVRGWLPYCAPTACTLYESKSAYDSFQVESTTMLSIARNTEFDAAVVGKTLAHVVLRATVNGRCIEPRPVPETSTDQVEDVIACIMHRPTVLIPIQLVQLTSGSALPPQ